MRILQMVPALESGGVESGTVDLARIWKKWGHEVYVMSSGGKLVKELVKCGVHHETLPIHVKSPFSLFLVPTVRNFIERERIDIVHARSRVPAWIGYFAARAAHVPFVTTCHGYYSKHFMSRVMGWGKEVIAISKAIGRHMIEDFGVPPERIHLIYRGIDLPRFPFDADKYLRRPLKARFVVANIGRITPIKGHGTFIKAIHLARRHIPGIEGWIVGDPDRGKEKYRSELSDLVGKLGLEKTVLFLGRREDVPEILHEADVLALTTLIPEGFGRVLAEAGACGTAVAAAQVGGVTEVVEHGKEGILVAAGDEEALAGAFREFAENPEKARSMALALREKVERDFSLETMARKTLRVYEKAKTQQKLAVLKFGSLGDLILAVPSFRMIRKKFPNAHIGLVVDSRWQAFMRACPYLDEIIPYDRSRRQGRWKRLFRLAKCLRSEEYEWSVDLQNNSKSHLLAFLARIPQRAGARRGVTGRLLTHSFPDHGKPKPPVAHQFETLKLVGIHDFDDKLELWVREEDRLSIQARLSESWVHNTQKLVGFSLSASASWPTKNWPRASFVELARQIGEKLSARVCLIGDRDSLALAAAFREEGLPNVIDLVGKTSLFEMVALIERLDVLVTGDSAPLHVAAALGTQAVALFGPTDPARHLPPVRDIAVFKKAFPCSPCYSGRCRAKEFVCMPAISVGEVFQAVAKFLASSKVALGST